MSVESTARAIGVALEESGSEFESPAPGSYLVTLPGEHKLKTLLWFVVGKHSVLVEAFVMRKPDENHQELYNFLLSKNARMYGVAWAIDPVGDLYLVGRHPHEAMTPEHVDTLCGSVLSYADGMFDQLLELGFGSSIKREWDWRAKNGESLANLKAFARFADPANRGPSADPANRGPSADPANR